MASQRVPLIDLDPKLYDPSPEEIKFLKSQTKIEDDEELKQHVLAVQKQAWDVVPYRCIQAFSFLTLKISFLPVYQDLLEIGKERQGAIFLELGCCFGNDIRKAVADGYPVENIVASDLVGAFWDLGHKLFKSTPETFPVPFIQGDIFDPQHITPAPPHYTPPTSPRPILSTLTSLTPLQGHVSALHISNFFHLFTKEQQIKAAHILASLLSPLPGSMIFGVHATLEVSGESGMSTINKTIYCFSPKDWCALWNGPDGVYKQGTVQVEAWFPENVDWQGKGLETEEMIKSKRRSMVWFVKRI